MPLIWNNKEYKLVPDNSGWDQLEFVIARKLHVDYKPMEVILMYLLANNQNGGATECVDYYLFGFCSVTDPFG